MSDTAAGQRRERAFAKRNPERLGQMPKLIPYFKTIPSWKLGQLQKMCIKVLAVADTGCQPEPKRKSI